MEVTVTRAPAPIETATVTLTAREISEILDYYKSNYPGSGTLCTLLNELRKHAAASR